MAWRIEFEPAAARELDKLDPQSAERILRFLRIKSRLSMTRVRSVRR
jgi:mRNA-degrading endonuclease RelE of RelBE toxin-antitoxin system